MAFACLTAGAQLTTITIQEGFTTVSGTSDNTIYEGAAYETHSNGGGQSIIVGKTGATASGALRRGLILFDLSSLPANIQIVDVTLSLNATSSVASAIPIEAFRLTNTWGEGTVDTGGPADDTEGQGEQAATGDATWLQNHYNVSNWTTPGGDFATPASGSGIVPLAGPTHIRGAGMIADVQAWANGSQPNNGWILRIDEVTSQSAKRFASAENATIALRPALVITYQPVTEVARAQWPE
ncbi:DNRLRE domain-containing protein [bacterium]|nr:DNRLRE domain-containing protein [bacterium]